MPKWKGKFIAWNPYLGKSKVEKSMMWTSISENQKRETKGNEGE